MFDIGWPEMLVIAIVMIVVVGPKDLPKMLRTFGRTTTKLRAMAGDFRKQFDEALKEAELDDLKTLAEDARKLNPMGEIKKAMSPMEKAAADVRAGLDAAMKPTKPAPAPAASPEAQAIEPAKAGATAMPGEGMPAKPAPAVKPAATNGAAAVSADKPVKIGARPAAPKAAPTTPSAALKAAAAKATAATPPAKAAAPVAKAAAPAAKPAKAAPAKPAAAKPASSNGKGGASS